MDQLKNAFKDIIAEVDSEILIADGFDDAILGYVERLGENGYQTYALYDKEKVIKMLENDMTREEFIKKHGEAQVDIWDSVNKINNEENIEYED